MMILFDFNHIVIEGASYSLHKTRILEPKLIRLVVLRKFGFCLRSFKQEYGKPVICREGGGYWRKGVFPQYKSGRADARQKDSMDWGTIFNISDMLAAELQEYFAIPCIKIKNQEADDVISAIVRKMPENHMIVSRDKDFLQLKYFGNVDQYDLIKKSNLEYPDDMTQDEFYVHMIIKGQSKDGVPNIFSDNNYLVESIRQSSVTKAMLADVASNYLDKKGNIKVEELVENILVNPIYKKVVERNNLTEEKLLHNIHRNITVLDFRQENTEIENEVYEVIARHDYNINFNEAFNFCSQNNLTEIQSNLNDYVVT